MAAGAFLLGSLVGCDSADDVADASPLAPPVSGLSPFDGQPIETLRAGDLADYARSVRDAVAARGLSAPAAQAGTEEGMVPLSVALGGDSFTGDSLSTHIVIADGGVQQQYVLYVDADDTSGQRGADDRYVVLDPDVFTPDPSDGQATQRDVPVTKLSTGEEAIATISAQGATVGGEEADLAVVEAVPVYDPADEQNPNAGIFGEPSPDKTVFGTPDENGKVVAVALGIRSLRVNQNFDADGTVSTKQEAQFTYQQTDNYGLEFPRYNTARFDGALWTLSGLSPVSGGTTTIQPVYTTYAGGVRRSLWYFAGDVNYSNTDYSFRFGSYYDCIYFNNNPATDCQPRSGQTDFPVIILPTGNPNYRVYMNEDDYAVTQFSTRRGDYSGPVTTVNFTTGSIATITTRMDANNHSIVSSDTVFASGGVRQINANALNNSTGGGSVTRFLNVNGLIWEFSRMTVDI